MKKIMFLLIFVAFSEMGFSQNEDTQSVSLENSNEIYSNPETKPEFVGGMIEFYNYVGKNYRVPNATGLNGKIIVQFVVEKDGSLSDIKVLKDLGHGTGNEAIRVVKKCPKWNPGKQNGIPVRSLYALPINISS